MTLDDDARADLAALERSHRRRVPRVLGGPQSHEIELDGRRVINFASNDYLGLASHPKLVEAATTSLRANGFGAGASRLVVGNHCEHVALEASLAEWLGNGRSVRLFSSGYAANVGVLSALLSPSDVVFSDELNHASIIDGCRLSRAKVVVYPHGDLKALESCLHDCATSGGRRLIVSESLFSMDGDIADVERLGSLARQYQAAWMLDEAHAIGVLGPSGRGLATEHGVVPDLLVGTMGKAFGGSGAFVAAGSAVVDWLWNRSRSFVFSTGLPPCVASAGRAALDIVRDVEGDRLRAKLQANIRSLRISARVGGWNRAPIAPVLVGDDERVMKLSASWLEAGVFVQGIRYPTVPAETARLRIGLTAAHTPNEVEKLAELIQCST